MCEFCLTEQEHQHILYFTLKEILASAGMFARGAFVITAHQNSSKHNFGVSL